MNNKILPLFQMKAFAGDIFSVVQLVQIFFDRSENIVGKVENDGYQHFQSFPHGC